MTDAAAARPEDLLATYRERRALSVVQPTGSLGRGAVQLAEGNLDAQVDVAFLLVKH